MIGVRRIVMGARAGGALVLAAALLASLAFAAPAQGQGTLDFERCTDPKEADWECATHTVPLDHFGDTPGTIDLAVRRFRPPGTPDPSDKPPFFALAGGPGQSAISALSALETAFGAAAARYQLIVYDQRGTGRSGALSCPALEGEGDPEADPEQTQAETTRRQAARCAEQLGARRAFYATLDSVADIDSLRRALGAARIGIGGVSYGTYVSAIYAQRHPERTERIVLDSVVPPDGEDVFERHLFGAVPRVLREQCEAGRCKGVTPRPVGDLIRLIAQAEDENLESHLAVLMQQGDTENALRAGQPAAFRAGARGDGAPFQRFTKLAFPGAGDRVQGAQGEEEPPDPSSALLMTTMCTDLDFPWSSSTPPGGERSRQFRNALASVALGEIWPFGRPALRGIAWSSKCLLWPLTDSAPPPDHPPFPDVPTFIVNGNADLRTPSQTAIAAKRDFAPDAALVLVEGQGHSVLPRTACARTALERFFADQPIGDPCGGVDLADPVQPLAPRRVRQIDRAPKTKGPRGRTLGAVLATIGDARWLRDVKEDASFRLEGLRGGRVAYREAKNRFRFRRLAYVPRVRLNGTLRLRGDDRLVGKLRVRGRRAVNGTVRFRPKGRVVGWLRGQRVRTRDTTLG